MKSIFVLLSIMSVVALKQHSLHLVQPMILVLVTSKIVFATRISVLVRQNVGLKNMVYILVEIVVLLIITKVTLAICISALVEYVVV
jgi:hypothetical protein